MPSHLWCNEFPHAKCIRLSLVKSLRPRWQHATVPSFRAVVELDLQKGRDAIGRRTSHLGSVSLRRDTTDWRRLVAGTHVRRNVARVPSKTARSHVHGENVERFEQAGRCVHHDARHASRNRDKPVRTATCRRTRGTK